MTSLIYIADPMCSWCYAFGPTLQGLMAARPEVRVDIMLGGLRAYYTAPTDNAFKTRLRGHWAQVHEKTGLPFDHRALDAPDFVYDTEPACRAVATMRSVQPDRALEYFHAVQRAFYRDARDVTSGDVLTDIAGEMGIDRAGFHAHWDSAAMRSQTEQDFGIVSHWGVRGFPTLVRVDGDTLALVVAGYAPLERVFAALDRPGSG